MKKTADLAWRVILYGGISFVLAFLVYFAQKGPIFSWIFISAVALIAAVALWEYYQFGRKKGLDPAVRLGVISAVCYVYAVFLKTSSVYPPPAGWQSFVYHLPEVILGLAFFACFVHYTFQNISPLLNIPITYLGIVYIAVPMGLIVRITYFFFFGSGVDLNSSGTWWLVYLILVTKSADMGGYFFGRFLGKHKLAEKVSPNKTYEGAIGGLVSSIVVSLLIFWLGKKYGQAFAILTVGQMMGLGLLIGIFGQLGDLAESLLKRDAGVKDSNKIPGIGGMLDTIDSLLLTAPVVYLFLRIYYT